MVQKYFNKYRIAIRTDYYTKQDEYGIKNYIDLQCYDTNVSMSNPVAELRFHDNVNFRKNHYLADSDRIILTFNINRFNDIYNLIRYEKPVYAYVDPQTLDGHVGSQLESVGQEDIEQP